MSANREDNTIKMIHPNEKMLEITLLYLQKIEILEPEDKQMYRRVIETFLYPQKVINGS